MLLIRWCGENCSLYREKQIILLDLKVPLPHVTGEERRALDPLNVQTGSFQTYQSLRVWTGDLMHHPHRAHLTGGEGATGTRWAPRAASGQPPVRLMRPLMPTPTVRA